MYSMFSIFSLFLGACNSDKAVTVFNTSPEVEIISHVDGDQVFEGYPIEFRATLSDANHSFDQLTARWFLHGLEICPSLPPNESGDSICNTTIQENTTEITVEVRDPQNASGTDSVSLIPIPTLAPTASIVQPISSNTLYADELIAFEGFIFDAEDSVQDLSYYWFSNLDGVLEEAHGTATSEGQIIGYTYLQEGQHAIELHVEDTTGKTGIASVLIEVRGSNTPPICSFTIEDSDQIGQFGDTLVFAGTATDPNIPNEELSVTWSSDKDGILGTSTPSDNGDVLFSNSNLSINSHIITMLVEDEKGASCSSSLEYTINSPPTINIIHPTSTSAFVMQEDILFSVVVGDLEDSPNELFLEWELNGTIISTQNAQATGIAEIMQSNLPIATHELVVSVTDTLGSKMSSQVYFEVVNQIPIVDSLTISPSLIYTNDNIIATASITDADMGQILQTTYEWHVVDADTGVDQMVQNGSNNQLDGTLYFDKNDEVYVIATPNDGFSNGTSLTSNSLTIQNTPPIMPHIEITPNPALEGVDDLLCSITTISQDDDGDTVFYEYQWFDPDQNLIQTTSGTADTTDILSSSAIYVGDWTCMVTPSDSEDDGQSALALTTVNPSSCGSLYFNGSDSGVVIPQNPLMDSPIFTAMFWVKMSPQAQASHLLVKGNNSTNEWSITNGSNNEIHFNRQGLYNSIATSSLEGDKWEHIAVTYDGTTAFVYHNGQMVGSSAFSFSPSPTDLVIGNIGICHNCAMLGHMSEVSYYSESLQNATIIDLYNGQISPLDISTLIGYWPLNEINSLLARDLSSNALDGNIGTATWDETCPSDDNDGDGYQIFEDCDDNDPSIHPLAGDNYGDTIDNDCDGFDCEAGFDSNGSYFTVCVDTAEKSFSEVELFCLNGGYDGVSLPLNSDENNYIFTASQTIWNIRPISNYSIRIGGTDAASEGNWLHDRLGTAMTYFNWANSEPTNSYGNEHCLNIIGDINYNGLWQDLGCHQPSNAAYAWSCEKRSSTY